MKTMYFMVWFEFGALGCLLMASIHSPENHELMKQNTMK
jgi:hypothetical protein